MVRKFGIFYFLSTFKFKIFNSRISIKIKTIFTQFGILYVSIYYTSSLYTSSKAITRITSWEYASKLI